MSQPNPPTPPEQPQPASGAQPDAAEAEPAAEPDDATPNRAARRAKGKQDDPSHVGPRGGHARQGRGPRSHTKRRTR